jgi:hypothetical protein
LPPARRASDKPIAIACFRLLTVLPDRPDLSWPRFISCMARSTFCWDFWPYLRPELLRRRPPEFLSGICSPLSAVDGAVKPLFCIMQISRHDE